MYRSSRKLSLNRLILSAFLALGINAIVLARAQSQHQSNPTLRETLRWIQTSLEAGGGDYEVGHEVRSERLEDFSGCQVHFAYSTHQVPFANGEPAPDKKPYRLDSYFNLGDIDPSNITFSRGEPSSLSARSSVIIRTRNDEKKIRTKPEWESEANAKPDDTFLIFALDAFENDYVDRFVSAFKHAVLACGGKPSLFAEPDTADSGSPLPAQKSPRSAASKPAFDPNAPYQLAPSRKDIPTIARDADGSVVSIVMSDKHGKPMFQGSGFLVSKDGLIITNYHVISEGSSAVAKLPDGAFYAVDGVVAYDKNRDVAVIKAHGENFETLPLGDSDQLRVGDDVVAIGNPLSLESTVSNGIVSGIRTSEELGGKFLQVTTPISHGSSGGPLLNMTGEVVGITTMYLRGGENLNFAIPINDAKKLLLKEPSSLQKLPDEIDISGGLVPKDIPREAPKEAQSEQPDDPSSNKSTRTPTIPISPSTKMAASPLAGHATQTQMWEDIKYCYENPANNLGWPDGTVIACKDINGDMETKEQQCRHHTAPKDTAKTCKGFLKTYNELKDGTLSLNY